MPPDGWKPVAVSAAVALVLAAPGVAQDPGQPTAEDPPAAEEPTGSVPGPPQISSLRLPRTATAQRGHARFLVGVRLSEPATLTVLISKAGDGTPVRTMTTETRKRAGLVYLLVDAVDDQRFQLPAGRYRVRVTATDTDDESSQPLSRIMTLRLTRARGALDAVLVPTYAPFARQAGTEPRSGHVVAAVGPRGTAVTAGLRRGDVLTRIGQQTINTPGELQARLRQLKANQRVRITYLRNGGERTGILQPKPDWTDAPDYQRVLRVARQRAPRSPVIAYAQVKERIDAGEPTEARALWARWPAAWRRSGPGEALSGEIFEANERHRQALGAYNRARARDNTLASARFGRGVAYAGLGRPEVAAEEFAAAAELDPADASAQAFRAYVLLRADRNAEARDAAAQAIRLDPRYADAHLPFGIALLALGQRSAGIKALRTGLRLLSDPERADALIQEHLNSSES